MLLKWTQTNKINLGKELHKSFCNTVKYLRAALLIYGTSSDIHPINHPEEDRSPF